MVRSLEGARHGMYFVPISHGAFWQFSPLSSQKLAETPVSHLDGPWLVNE